ncbi:CUB and sushi domain-containing protein 3 [Porites harrisoni]
MFRIGSIFLCVLLLPLTKANDDNSVKKCPVPKAPENAFAIGNNTVGSKVRILCTEGFFRMGKPVKIQCQTNGQWTETNVTCVAKSCGDPGSPTNGNRVGWLFQYNQTVRFKCLEGYILEGPKARTCQANQTWSGIQPICKPITCEDPPKVVGAMMVDSGGFVFKEQVRYNCRDGYRMEGSGTLTCAANGKWIGEIPVCKAIFCEDPGTPQNGSRTGSAVFKYGEKLSFLCNKGFILFGSHERSCEGGGKWTGVQPYCVECAGVDTPVFIRKGIRFIQGLIKEKRGYVVTVLTQPSDEEEDVVILGRGTQHYIIVQDKVPPPKDIFLGTKVIAKHPNTAKYTFAKVNSINDEKYSVTFEDKRGTTATLTIDSIRTLDPPRFCASCPDPGKPDRGFREDDLLEFIPGTEVEYGCEINTQLMGSSKRKCLPSGLWTGVQPTCKITSCWDLDVFPPKNGKRTGDEFGIGSSVSFTCNQGYELIGSSTLTCQADGQWSGIVPICKDLCESTKCETWQKCVFDGRKGPICVCRDDLDCPAEFKPVCGSDAKRYNNECIMKATACREGKLVKKAADGFCTPGGICQIVPISNCRAHFNHFYFNMTSKMCESIVAGGCHPSGWNGFTSMDDCNRTCSVDVCAQPADPGPCETNVTRWAFNPKAGRCKRFNYGGCFGRENNFETKEKCNQRCPPTDKARNAGCPKCSRQVKIRVACKESDYAFVGKVQRNLPDNSTKNTTRYLVSISKILKNTNGSLSVGTAVISVPHGKTPGCPCPSLPKVTFFLMGQVEINPIDGQAKVDITVKQSTVVQRMNNKDYIEKLKKKCAAYFDLTKFE